MVFALVVRGEQAEAILVLPPCTGEEALRRRVLVSSKPVCRDEMQENGERRSLKAERREWKDRTANGEVLLLGWDDRYRKRR